jgi:hypothetical protein
MGVLLVLAGGVLGAFGVLLWQQWQGGNDHLPPRRWEATVYLPLRDNQGNEFTEEEKKAAIEVFIKRFGGATLAEKREGYWLDDNKLIQDDRIQLLIVSFEHHRLGEFREAVAEVGRRLGQESMYVRFEEPRIELIDIKKGR